MFMDATKKITALFDCDGVIVDTEGQYTVFWNEMGQKYVNDENFGNGREARALFEKVSVQMAKRIMGDANGGLQNSINEKAIKQCRISVIEGAIRRAREENKQISGRVKVHNRIGF